MKDPYAVLGITLGDDLATVKSKYRKLCLKYHPDHNPGNKMAEEKFKEIQDAWAYLKNSFKENNREPMWVHTSLFSIKLKEV